MPKHILEIFSKYEPSARAKAILASSGENRLRYDREQRIVEMEVAFPELVLKEDLYEIETAICAAYQMSYVKLLPKYPAALLSYYYIPQVLIETERTGVVARGFFSDYTYEFDGRRLTVDLHTLQSGVDLVNDFKTPQVIEGIIFSEFGVRVSAEIICSDPMVGYSDAVLREYEAIDSTLSQLSRSYSPDYGGGSESNGYYRRQKDAPADAPESDESDEPQLTRVTSLYAAPEVPIDQPQDPLIYDSGCRRFDLSAPDYVYGDEFDVRPVHIARITQPQHNIVVVGDVFDFKNEPTRSGDKNNVSFSLTDYNSSIDVRLFGLDPDEAKTIESFAPGATLALYGSARQETRKDNKATNEIIFRFQHAARVRVIGREDNAPEKRVELHLHTTMSTMDALISPPDVIKIAKKWGHTAIAITDHGNLQAYPEAMLTAEKLGGVKVIYGMEAYFVNNTSSALYGGGADFEGEFVVFDIETTGLSNRNDHITEIGAVRIRAGEIVETFGTYANPGMHIPEEITKLTGITDEMVAGAPSQLEAVREFLDFVGGHMLIAHNADFDMGFIRRVCDDNGIPFNHPYLDTVALSRYLNPELKNHKLDTLAKYFELEDFNHHRAYDDASILAKIFLCMVEKMRGMDIRSFSDLTREMSENADPMKLRTYHQIILVKNAVGLKNLYKIVSESYLNYFHRNPRVPKTVLEKYREGLIIGSACEAGELYTAILDNKPESEIERIAEFYDYLEIQPVCNNRFLVDDEKLSDDDAIRDINRRIYELGKRLGKPVVATCDAHFANPEDEIYRKILRTGMKFKDADRDCGLYLRTTKEMLGEFSYLGEEAAYEVVVKNTNLIADMVEEVRPIPKGFFTPSIEGADEELRDMCWKKAHSMYGDELPAVVSERLEKELNSIIEHGFAALYIIAQRLVKFSEDNGYLVGSRGSVGSSLVAIMASVSEVNPLPPHYWCPNCRFCDFENVGNVGSGFDLPDRNCPACGQKLLGDGHDIPFETFLGFYGDKFPDIDLNFSGDVQGRVHKFTEELFGVENVFRAGTLGTLADKTAYGFVVKYLENKGISLPRAEVNRLIYGCVGVKRTTGQHPGGIVVIPKEYDVCDFTPVQHPADDPKSNIITTHFAFTYLHDTILKLDELGHDMPTKYKYLEKYSNTSVLDVPMNDRSIYDLFLSTKPLGVSPEDINCPLGTLGLPELGTKFVVKMLQESKPQSFADLLQVSGLSHGTDVWTNNAQDLIKDGTCNISEVIGTRDSIMLALIKYGVEKSHSFKIMEMVRKGKGLTPEFETEMRAANVPEWYISSCKKIKYMFPKAHAAAYDMSAIRLGWYKVHMPLAFYCAMFTVQPLGFDGELVMRGKATVKDYIADIERRQNSNDNPASQKELQSLPVLMLVNEAYARGIRFLPVDLEKSSDFEYLPENGKIRLPFSAFAGIGENAAASIISARNDEPFFSVEDLRTRAGLTKSVIEILRRNGALDNLNETDQLTFMI